MLLWRQPLFLAMIICGCVDAGTAEVSGDKEIDNTNTHERTKEDKDLIVTDVKVVVSGSDDIAQQIKKWFVETCVGRALPDDQTQNIKTEIISALGDAGYKNPSVKIARNATERGVVLQVNVSLNEQTFIRRSCVMVEPGSWQLKRKFTNALVGVWWPWQRDALDKQFIALNCELIKKAAREMGYFDVVVSVCVEGEDCPDVIYTVKTGERYNLGPIVWRGPWSTEVRQKIIAPVGEYFSAGHHAMVSTQVMKVIRKFDVFSPVAQTIELNPIDKTVSFVLSLGKEQVVQLEELDVSGNTKTYLDVIYPSLGMYPGDIITPERLFVMSKYGKLLFTSMRVTRYTESLGLSVLEIDRDPFSFQMGADYNSLNGPDFNIALSVSDPNLFGQGIPVACSLARGDVSTRFLFNAQARDIYGMPITITNKFYINSVNKKQFLPFGRKRKTTPVFQVSEHLGVEIPINDADLQQSVELYTACKMHEYDAGMINDLKADVTNGNPTFEGSSLGAKDVKNISDEDIDDQIEIDDLDVSYARSVFDDKLFPKKQHLYIIGARFIHKDLDNPRDPVNGYSIILDAALNLGDTNFGQLRLDARLYRRVCGYDVTAKASIGKIIGDTDWVNNFREFSCRLVNTSPFDKDKNALGGKSGYSLSISSRLAKLGPVAVGVFVDCGSLWDSGLPKECEIIADLISFNCTPGIYCAVKIPGAPCAEVHIGIPMIWGENISSDWQNSYLSSLKEKVGICAGFRFRSGFRV